MKQNAGLGVLLPAAISVKQNNMKKYLLILGFVLVACSPTVPKVDWQTIDVKNGCEINAMGYKAAYSATQSQQKWYYTKILVIVWHAYKNNQTTANAHAVCIVEWPHGIYAYDQSKGTWRLTTNLSLKDQPKKLAELWCNGLAGTAFQDAYFKDL
jgi:hypothetical protein